MVVGALLGVGAEDGVVTGAADAVVVTFVGVGVADFVGFGLATGRAPVEATVVGRW